MIVDFVPSTPVGLSLAACALLPGAILGLSHGPSRITAPGRRFVVATALTWTAWAAVMIAAVPGWIDFVTGALLLATATVAGFTLWTLIAWGFTLSMLLALDRAGRPLTVEQWALTYTRGRSLAAFARDRLGLLHALGLARIRAGDVIMTPRRGRLVANGVGLLRKVFGLER